MILHPYLAEFIGTSILILLGAGVVANINLKKTIASEQTPWVLITSAWGFAVFVGVYVSAESSGAHLNPAVTLGLVMAGKFSWSLVPGYFLAQILGAMFGSWLAYLTYIDHYRATTDEGAVKSTFCTGPAIRNLKNNLFSEAIGTFMLVFGALFIVSPKISIVGTEVENFGLGALDALPVGILVWVIGISLGGTTGYAINPARDFGPRLVYQLIPRKNKDADWGYSWIPIVGPFIGGGLAGLIYSIL
ncbi:aquaporin family protein [Flavobacteriaceae bacterium]|jgi:glycerol uptake facilitator protein|nr:aquaporin family protein [Flavobacteriaceae bacterium]